MELRGHRRANKPQSGLFSRHYHSIKGGKAQCAFPPANRISAEEEGAKKRLPCGRRFGCAQTALREGHRPLRT